MSGNFFLELVFVVSAILAFSYLFRTDKVQAAMARICNKHQFLDLVMGQWLDESPYCMMGVLGLVIAAVADFALMSRLANRIP